MVNISKLEQTILINKHVKEGMSYEEAKAKVEYIVNFLNDLVFKMKQKGKSEKDINKKFKSEFEKLTLQTEKTRKRGNFTK